MKKEHLDKRICDIENCENEQTYREFIIQSEFCFCLVDRYKDLDGMSSIELTDLIDYLEDLWDK